MYQLSSKRCTPVHFEKKELKGNPRRESLSGTPTQFLGPRRNHRSGTRTALWVILIACLIHSGTCSHGRRRLPTNKKKFKGQSKGSKVVYKITDKKKKDIRDNKDDIQSAQASGTFAVASKSSRTNLWGVPGVRVPDNTSGSRKKNKAKQPAVLPALKIFATAAPLSTPQEHTR